MIDLQNFNKTIYLKNNFLIRTLKINDIKQGYVESLQDPNVNKYLFFRKKKITIKNIKQYVLKNFISSNNILFGIFFNKKHIGNIRLTLLENESILGITIFDQFNQQKGFGSKSLDIVSKFAIKNLKSKSIKGGIDLKNTISIKTFKKAGFLIKKNLDIYNKYSSKYCLAIKKK